MHAWFSFFFMADVCLADPYYNVHIVFQESQNHCLVLDDCFFLFLCQNQTRGRLQLWDTITRLL
jgi:hypothetical protein